MRFNSVVFPAPRKPVRIVIGTVFPLSSMISMVQGLLSKGVRPPNRPAAMGGGTPGTAPLFLELTQVDSHHLGQCDQIDLLRVCELGDRVTINLRRIVLMRINLEVTCELFLLLLARQPRLWNDAHARR